MGNNMDVNSPNSTNGGSEILLSYRERRFLFQLSLSIICLTILSNFMGFLILHHFRKKHPISKRLSYVILISSFLQFFIPILFLIRNIIVYTRNGKEPCALPLLEVYNMKKRKKKEKKNEE